MVAQLFLLLFPLLSGLLPFLQKEQSLNSPVKAKKPNIVLIMADDMGYECLSSYGSAIYNTPNLDKLAGQDVLFFDVAKDVREQQPLAIESLSAQGKAAYGQLQTVLKRMPAVP